MAQSHPTYFLDVSLRAALSVSIFSVLTAPQAPRQSQKGFPLQSLTQTQPETTLSETMQ